jgi:predicted ATP-dependent serine protease
MDMQNIMDVQVPDALQTDWPTGDEELDQLFTGHGIKRGSIILVAGAGGGGKSTFCQQLADKLASNPKAVAIYNGREEAAEQMKLAIQRLKLKHGFFLTTHGKVEDIIADCNAVDPSLQKFVFIDSLQALAAPTQKAQVEALEQLHSWAKATHTTVFVISMVGKAGIYLGSGKLNHIVDMTIKMRKDEAKRSITYGEYLLSVEKNRFGQAHFDRIYTLDGSGFKLLSQDSFRSRLAQLTGTVATADSAFRKVNMGLRVIRGVKKLFG